jgi:lambda family phage portal protein
MLRSVAAGLGESYNSLAQDLESVNFSSIRAGALAERDDWMLLQNLMIERMTVPIFERWLTFQIATGKINLPLAKLEKFKAAQFIGRRWDWVDPKSDIEATRTALALRLTSWSKVVAERTGGKFKRLLKQIKQDKAAMNAEGLSDDELFTVLTMQLPPQEQNPPQK